MRQSELSGVERLFAPTKREIFVAAKLRERGIEIDLDATASIRRERIRLAICDHELAEEQCLVNRAGEPMTYGEVFEAMYGQPLNPRALDQSDPVGSTAPHAAQTATGTEG